MGNQLRFAGLILSCAGMAGACGDAPAEAARYRVTVSPINLGVGAPLCIAVEPRNPKGVWWWHPGATGCVSRSSGPGIFEAQRATVAAAPARKPWAEIRFRLPLHGAPSSSEPPFVDVVLTLDDDHLIAPATQTRVAVESRATLDISEKV
jgi:hypothetical protein